MLAPARLAAGLALAVRRNSAAAFNSGLNWLRFGSVLNQWYLRPTLIVPDWPTRANFFAAIWVAPNGGLAVFWPASVLLLLLVGTTVFRRVSCSQCTSPGNWWLNAWPFLCVILVLACVTAGHASWHAPLGWDAWGPRLILPWIPASLFLVLFAYGNEIDRAMEFLERRPVLWVIIMGTVAGLSLPQVSVIFRPEMYVLWFRWKPTPEFPEPRHILRDPAYFYRSEKYDLWQREWILKPAYNYQPAPQVLGLAIADSFAITVLLPLLARARAPSMDAHAGESG